MIGSLDVVMAYSYGRSDHRLEKEDFAPGFHHASVIAGRQGSLFKQMFWIFRIVDSLPDWLAVHLVPGFNLVLQLRRVRRFDSP